MKIKSDDMDIKLKILKIFENNPNINQREMAEKLGLSLGKTHYVIRALIDRGWIKIGNFKRSKYKSGYAYYLTKKGVSHKADLGIAFLARKQDEYQRLKEEISKLESEVLGEISKDSNKEQK
jgi:Transcriptional regulators